MKTTNLKWIAYALAALMLMQSCGAYSGNATITGNSEITKKKVRTYKAWVTLMDGTKQIGTLFNTNEDGIIIYVKNKNELSKKTISVTSIKQIKLRRKGKVGTGMMVGFFTGLLTGGIIGFASGDDPSKTHDYGWPIGTVTTDGTSSTEKAAGMGILLSLAGSGIGAVIASKKNKIMINGSIENFNTNLPLLIRYSMYSKSIK